MALTKHPVVLAALSAALLILSACSGNTAETASGTSAAAMTSSAPSTAGASTPKPEAACTDLTGAQAVDKWIGQVPTTDGWNWDRRSAEVGDYDKCQPLSAVSLTIESATSSSPYQVMMFHGGQYVGTATPTAYGFRPDVRRIDAKTIEITFNYPKQGESNAARSGKAVSRFTWDDSANKVVRTGDLPDSPGQTSTPNAASNTQVGGNCGVTSQGLKVLAGPSTSCAFALAVAEKFGSAGLPMKMTMSVESPTTGKTYEMECHVGSSRTGALCTGGNGARLNIDGFNVAGR